MDTLKPQNLEKLEQIRILIQMVTLLCMGGISVAFIYSEWDLLFNRDLFYSISFGVILFIAVILGFILPAILRINEYYMLIITFMYGIILIYLRFFADSASDSILRLLITTLSALTLFNFTAFEGDLFFRNPQNNANKYRFLASEGALVFSPLITTFVWYPFSQNWATDGVLILFIAVLFTSMSIKYRIVSQQNQNPSIKILFKEQCKIIFNIPNILRTAIWLLIFAITVFVLYPGETHAVLDFVLYPEDIRAIPVDYISYYLVSGLICAFFASITILFFMEHKVKSKFVALLIILCIQLVCAYYIYYNIVNPFSNTETLLTIFLSVFSAVLFLMMIAVPIGRYICIKVQQFYTK